MIGRYNVSVQGYNFTNVTANPAFVEGVQNPKYMAFDYVTVENCISQCQYYKDTLIKAEIIILLLLLYMIIHFSMPMIRNYIEKIKK